MYGPASGSGVVEGADLVADARHLPCGVVAIVGAAAIDGERGAAVFRIVPIFEQCIGVVVAVGDVPRLLNRSCSRQILLPPTLDSEGLTLTILLMSSF